MGMLNPRTGQHEAIVEVRTADGKPPTKGSDILFYKLESGDIVGVGDSKEYLDVVKKVRTNLAENIQASEQAAKKEIIAAYDKLVVGGKGGRN